MLFLLVELCARNWDSLKTKKSTSKLLRSFTRLQVISPNWIEGKFDVRS